MVSYKFENISDFIGEYGLEKVYKNVIEEYWDSKEDVESFEEPYIFSEEFINSYTFVTPEQVMVESLERKKGGKWDVSFFAGDGSDDKISGFNGYIVEEIDV